MLQIRVRLVKDDGTVDASSRVLETLSATLTTPHSAAATLKFQVSRQSFDPLVMPFVVRVEYAVDGGKFAPIPEHDLFLVEKDADDSKDTAEVVSYDGVGFVPWLLAGAYVGTGTWQKDNERTINGDGSFYANAGQIMAYFIDESKGRGWLPALNRNFNAFDDSNGVAWLPSDMEKIAWKLETFYSKVLDQLTEQGFCEWSSSGRGLNLYRYGTLGVDRSTELVFGGPEFRRVPVKSDTSGWWTHVIGLSDAGRVHANNAAAEARFGRRSVVQTQSGVKDAATSARLANTLLADGQTVRREEGYEWTPAEGGLHPFEDFHVGDMVTALSRGGKQKRRINALVVTQGEEGASVQVRVGEKISTLAARNQKKLGSMAVGGVAGGSGAAFPWSPGLPDDVPDAPNALIVASNVGEWLSDGSARAAVDLAWTAVTASVDGAEIDIVEYEVWSRLPAGTFARDTAVTGPAAVVASWEPGVERLVVVRAKSARSIWGAFSLELSVTPVMPGSIVPAAPVGLTASSNVGSFTPAGAIAEIVLTCTPVSLSTDGEPVTVVEYEVWDAAGPLMRVPAAAATVTLPSGQSSNYRMRARSDLGLWGDVSAPLAVTGALPAATARAPSTPLLKTGFGLVAARWDGLYETGGTVGAHNVFVEARVAPGGWVVQGAALSGAGGATFEGTAGDLVEVRLQAYDQAGRLTGTSAKASITVVAIGGDDLDAADIWANAAWINVMSAGVIAVDMLKPNVGEDLNLAANGSIVLIAGRQDEQATAISDVADTAANAANSAAAAADVAGAADAKAAAAAGAVLVAQATANAADAKATELGTVLRLTPEGLTLGRQSGTNELRLTPEAVEIAQNGVAVSRWEGGRFIVNEAILNRAQIAGHSFDKYATGETIIRPI